MNKIIIDVNNLFNNLAIVKRLASNSKICAVVKANAYGHGMIRVCKLLEDHVDYFAVSTIKEAIEIRKNNIKTNILVLGYVLPEQINDVVKYDLEITIGSKEQLISYNNFIRDSIKIHLKKDSGLHRYGYSTQLELEEILKYIVKSKKFSLVGFYTHFVISDENCEDKISTQSIAFEKDANYVRSLGFNPTVHASSSTTLFLTKKYQYDMVRIGMALYGFCGFDEPLKKVLSVESRVVDIKHFNDAYLGYGERQKIHKDFVRAIIPIGYGYGISSLLANKSFVVINKTKCPIIGEMSMDCMYVDVTGLSNVKVGDKVVFVGDDDGVCITATDHAGKLGVYSCEILTGLNVNRFDLEVKK